MEQLWRVSPLIAGAIAILGSTTAVKAQTIPSVDALAESATERSQVTSVSQLSDVQPTDWAFQALQSLVERYGCIAGYPDGTYRGNRALTRYEFAAGLNACLDQVLALVGGDEGIDPESLATIRRLQEEFAAELATLRGRVDALEARTAELEANQFSTTTKLSGEVIFGLENAFGEGRALNPLQRANGVDDKDPGVDDNTIFGDRVRLVLDTSFTGKDRLRTRLQASNIANLNGATGTDETRLAYDGDNGNNLVLNRLHYRAPIGDKLTFHIGTTGLDIDQIFDVTNPFLASDATGVVSRFGRRNPLVHRNYEGAGIGFNYDISDSLGFSAFYLADGGDAGSPVPKDGLFNGAHSAGAQLDFTPGDAFHLSLTYLRAYAPGDQVNVASSTGTDFAQNPFLSAADDPVATSGNHLGIQTNVKLGDRVGLGGWAGAAFVNAESGSVEGADATIFNWAFNLAFPDLGGKGNLLGFVVGQPPHVTDNDISVNGIAIEDRDAPWHLEALYRIAVSDKISVTPGAFYIINPEGDDRNENLLVGVIRTTFKF
ncbi:MAG TPA: iron uptake porin [Oscillatoriales cyanobacterium M59_W2019_021]|nr:iron uptake porin [Oscillatoriales cyanobacterium M4454_W2019_049]HIK49380.1 iron uptake porin [Oscillatoriales cyanobacterium M59_W2019_021]